MDHLPECPLVEACDDEIPEHGYCSMQHGMFCIHCHQWCICDALRACKQRALDAARKAIAEQKLVPLAKQRRFIITRNTQLWKQRQAWSELGWWDFRTSALAAIDALKETNVNA